MYCNFLYGYEKNCGWIIDKRDEKENCTIGFIIELFWRFKRGHFDMLVFVLFLFLFIVQHEIVFIYLQINRVISNVSYYSHRHHGYDDIEYLTMEMVAVSF